MEGCSANNPILNFVRREVAAVLCTLFFAPLASAHFETNAITEASEPEPVNAPLIAIIIDDLGNQLTEGRRTIALDGPIACAFMPHTAHASRLATEAHAAGKEVMLHLPMQPMEMDRIAGPGEISLENSRYDLRRILAADLSSVPHVVGVNNHMGSLITRHPGHMDWLMAELSDHGDLFFVDSYTTPASVAYSTALERGVPAVRRHVFLDDEPGREAVQAQFERLKRQAQSRGYAVAIGHPYPATLDVLENELPKLTAQGFELVSVQDIVQRLAAGELRHDLPERVTTTAMNRADAAR